MLILTARIATISGAKPGVPKDTFHYSIPLINSAVDGVLSGQCGTCGASPELRASASDALPRPVPLRSGRACLGQGRPSPGAESRAGARAAGAHVAANTVPGTETTNVFRANFESARGEVRAQFARAVGWSRVPQHVEYACSFQRS